ncbi:OmpA family protein [Acidovorax sp. NCPPB 2350]|nr:OmpA family protein [Acidovorax sp. NCPPB 2350]
MSSKADKGHEATIVKRGGGKHHDDEHGGAWKVAFADFCLALLCLFLVLWLMAARQTESLQEVMQAYGGRMLNEGSGTTAESLGGPRGSLIERMPLPSNGDTEAPRRTRANSARLIEETDQGFRLSKTRLESRSDLQELADLLERMGDKVGLSGNVQSVITPQGLRVMLHDTDKEGMFHLGSSQPNNRFRELLRKMGPLFAQIENQLLVVGHTDSLQYAGGELAGFSNWTLSMNRAMASRAELMAGGMPAQSVLQVVGMADRAPMDPSNTRAATNRRIELLVLTSDQSRAVADMFGTPGTSAGTPLPGVELGLTERESLRTLARQIRPPERGALSAP